MHRFALPLAFAAALGLGQPAMAQEPAEGPVPTLSVSGHGTASAEPDIATIRLGVETQAEAPAAAMQENTAAVERIIATMNDAGIEERDVQTANFSVYPVYDHRRMEQEGGRPILVGFRVSNEVVVRVRNLDTMGAVLSGVIDAGANQVNSLNFSIDDPTPLEDEARKAAVADARRKADLYAAAAGVKLVRILSIQDGFAPRPPMPMDGRMMRMEMAESAAVPIQRGESAVDAQVNVVWEIAPAE